MASQDMPNELPFRPWWWHPNRYEGRHRGTYQFAPKIIPLGEALPYGLRDVKVTPYIDNPVFVETDQGYEWDGMVSIGFTETEEAALPGDDKITTTRGPVEMDWTMEITDINQEAMTMLFGEKWNSKTATVDLQAKHWWNRCVTRLMKLSKSIWNMIATGDLRSAEKTQ